MSLPQTAAWLAAVGTMTWLTPKRVAPVRTSGSVVTMKLLAGVSAPNCVLGQVTTPLAGIAATQWRAVTTRLGASNAPEQSAVPRLVWARIPTANWCVPSSLPPWMGSDEAATSDGRSAPQPQPQGTATARASAAACAFLVMFTIHSPGCGNRSAAPETTRRRDRQRLDRMNAIVCRRETIPAAPLRQHLVAPVLDLILADQALEPERVVLGERLGGGA